MNCKYCHCVVFTDPDCSEVICGACVQKLLYKVVKNGKTEEEKYPPEVSKSYRKEKGWSQDDLALHLSIPKGQISNFERGATSIPDKLLILLKE